MDPMGMQNTTQMGRTRPKKLRDPLRTGWLEAYGIYFPCEMVPDSEC